MVKKETKRVFFTLLIVVVSMLFLELFFAAFSFFSPKVNDFFSFSSPLFVPDERLGVRPRPGYGDHDDKGFRNLTIPREVEIVALGDSQTYGMGVNAQDAWPRQLEQRSTQRVYSMAFGGYGPAHSLILWDEALEFQPHTILEAFYFGNDFADVYEIIYNSSLPELNAYRSIDQEVLSIISNLENEQSIREQVVILKNSGGTSGFMSSMVTLSGKSRLVALQRKAWHIWRDFLADYRPVDPWEKSKKFATNHPEYCQILEEGAVRTILTPEYRILALNIDDARIREGIRLSRLILKKMNDDAKAKNKRFVTVIIPTKEFIFHPFAVDNSERLAKIYAVEAKLRDEMILYFQANKIEFIDTLAALRNQISIGKQPYPVTHDGHPNSEGHEAIADAISQYLIAGSGPE